MIDGRQFNIQDEDGRFLCPACGYPGFSDEAAYDERGGLIGTAICSCCYWEPGFDDDAYASATADESILLSLRKYRAGWTEAPTWKGRAAEQPPEWDGASQLAKLFNIAPHIR